MATEHTNNADEECYTNSLAFPVFHSLSQSELEGWKEFVIQYQKVASQYITVKFVGPNKHSVYVKIKRGQYFKKAMTMYADSLGVKLSKLLFGFREYVLNPATDMPLSCNLQDNDTVHVYLITRKLKSVPGDEDVDNSPEELDRKEATGDDANTA